MMLHSRDFEVLLPAVPQDQHIGVILPGTVLLSGLNSRPEEAAGQKPVLQRCLCDQYQIFLSWGARLRLGRPGHARVHARCCTFPCCHRIMRSISCTDLGCCSLHIPASVAPILCGACHTAQQH